MKLVVGFLITLLFMRCFDLLVFGRKALPERLPASLLAWQAVPAGSATLRENTNNNIIIIINNMVF